MAWLPIESNPDVMNKYLQKLGVPEKWNIVDVFGLDSDSLAWVPKPVLAVILLFPCSDKYYQYTEEQNKDIKGKGQDVVKELYFLKQHVSNACGTVALIHSIANNTDRICLADGAFKTLLDDSLNINADERGQLLQNSTQQLMSAHQELALEGQSEPSEKVNHHFIAFVHKGGHLYELDGRKEFPINHGPTTADSLLEDAAKICKEFMAREPDDVNFTVLALTAKDN